ncbi:unnamed protein product [Alternaria burnsii]|nr:unnamed protein product [Alternaria burnsii]
MSVSNAPTLCDQCSPMFQGLFYSGGYGWLRHHASLQSLEQAANKNCIIYRDVWKAMTGESDFDREILNVRATQKGGITEYCLYMFFHDHEGFVAVDTLAGRSGSKYLSFKCKKTQLEHHTPLHASFMWTGSTSNLEAPKKWLQQCLRTHPKCQAAENLKAKSPIKSSAIRLLHIEEAHEDRVRLLVDPFSDPVLAPRYATLSHCWGQDPFFMLTNQTKDQLTSGISTSILSQTFQDAVSAAKALGIQYIWIDSLCILQDSEKDWEEQAPLMNEIYSHALLCIAATASAKSSSGCFRTREASSRVTCEVKTSWNDYPNGIYQIYNAKIWPNAFEDQPLMSRAWVVQELQLAPRILFFNSNQIFWQCYDQLACEELPTQIITDHRTALQKRFKFKTYDYHHQPLIGDRAQPMIRNNEYLPIWRTILEQYTKCRLTFPKDKLVAISGIAKLFCEPLCDTYCAGLWVRRMPIELLWNRGIWGLPKPALPKPTRECYRAPSWSWANMNEPVTPYYIYDEAQNNVVILVEIKSCYATTKTGDTFSEVLYGVIRLSGFLSKMQLRPVSHSERGTQWNVFLNGMWLGNVVLDHERPNPQEMFCLPILLQKDLFDCVLECLILVAIEGKKDTFERFGRLTIPVDELLEDYRKSELGGVDSDSELGDEDIHVEVQSRDSAWHHFILSWSKWVVNSSRIPDDSLDFQTIAVPGAVEISIE